MDEWQTWARIFIHCCSNVTGGVPTLVASCTRNKFSLLAVLPSTVCNKATDANHVDKASVLNSPEHKSCPAVKRKMIMVIYLLFTTYEVISQTVVLLVHLKFFN